jgi:hypothetical protein
VAGRLQNAMGDLASMGEKLQSLLSWRDPRYVQNINNLPLSCHTLPCDDMDVSPEYSLPCNHSP